MNASFCVLCIHTRPYVDIIKLNYISYKKYSFVQKELTSTGQTKDHWYTKQQTI